MYAGGQNGVRRIKWCVRLWRRGWRSGGGQAWLQNVVQPSDPTRSRQKVYNQRDASGLSRKAFFMQEFGNPALAAVRLEVGRLPPPATN